VKPACLDAVIAVCWGAVCHSVFAIAIALMVANLYTGMGFGLGTLDGVPALVANLALLLQFPLLHSALLTGRGRRILAALAPRGLGRDLAPTTYSALAALQIAATFLLWSPSGITWWQPGGFVRIAWIAPFALSWLFLTKAIADGGLGLQTGWIGWTAVLRGRRPAFGPMPERGLFARCRQPIYLGFAATLWTGPVWTPDHLLIATIWTTYCVVGPRHKERRFARIHGQAFADYRRRVPFMIPRVAHRSTVEHRVG
jgi:protein-S-isoprenylcysteine O-methyltransferase Ste14